MYRIFRIYKLLVSIALLLCCAPFVFAQPAQSLCEAASKLPDKAGLDARGRLIRSDFLGSATRDQVAQGLAATGWPDVVVKTGIDLQRLVYTTIDAHGSPTIASGLLVLPTDMGPIATVVFEHGTTAQKTNVLSTPGSGEGQAIAGLFGSGGFALVAPDYLGLGLSPGPHPYLHAASEATATVDLLRAAKEAARSRQTRLPRRLYLTGFSQGGQAALATDRLIENERCTHWRVAAVAPIAGPYDLADTEFQGLLTGPSPDSSAYLAYLAVSYIRVYGAETNGDVFQPPYDSQIDSLFDGQNPLEQIAQTLPPPGALFRPEFLDSTLQTRNAFANQLKENNTTGITPRAPVRLYYGEADVDVFPQNTLLAASAMKSAGVQVDVIDLGPGVDHPASAQLGLPAARAWFDLVAEDEQHER
ncbi:MAG: alpha/beta fold hydrolase [Silvibacterium sp.]|nr:alpha/beta fold hydrolase [Silvibacterium sp.]